MTAGLFLGLAHARALCHDPILGDVTKHDIKDCLVIDCGLRLFLRYLANTDKLLNCPVVPYCRGIFDQLMYC